METPSITIQLVNNMLADAILKSVQEVCLEPRLKDIAVIYVAKGVPKEVAQLPRQMEQKVFNRLVTLAGRDYWRPGPARHGVVEYSYNGKPCRFSLTFEPGMMSEDLVLRRIT